MKTEIEKAINKLAGRLHASVTPDEAMKVSQAVLNLAHAIVTLENTKEKPPE